MHRTHLSSLCSRPVAGLTSRPEVIPARTLWHELLLPRTSESSSSSSSSNVQHPHHLILGKRPVSFNARSRARSNSIVHSDTHGSSKTSHIPHLFARREARCYSTLLIPPGMFRKLCISRDGSGDDISAANFEYWQVSLIVAKTQSLQRWGFDTAIAIPSGAYSSGTPAPWFQQRKEPCNLLRTTARATGLAICIQGVVL